MNPPNPPATHPNERASLEDFLKEDGNLENATRVAAARKREATIKVRLFVARPGAGLKQVTLL